MNSSARLQFSFLVALLCFSLSKGIAQPGVYQVKYKITEKNALTILNNKQIVGYAFFYQIDKMKSSGLYRLVILDENLKEIGANEFEGGKDLELLKILYESESFFLCFEDNTKYNGFKNFIKVIDLKGKELGLVGYDPDKVSSGLLGGIAASKMSEGFEGIENIENKGIVRIYQSRAKTGGVDIQFINPSGKLVWEKNVTANTGERTDMYLFGTTPNAILMVQLDRSALLSRKGEYYITGFSPVSGTQLFKRSLKMNGYHHIPQMIKRNAEGKYIIVSNLLNENEKLQKAGPKGIGFFQIDDLTGEMTLLKEFTYENDLNNLLKMKTKTRSELGFIHLQDLIFMTGGEIVLVGEFFSESKEYSYKSIIDDMFLLRLDKNFNASSFEKIETTGYYASSLGAGPSGQVAMLLKAFNAFQYRYTDEGMDGNRKIIVAHCEINDLGFGKYAIEIQENSGYIVKELKGTKEKNVSFYVNRAKPGFVMVTKYDHNEKALSFSLEKID